jgi:hypothetical protein
LPYLEYAGFCRHDYQSGKDEMIELLWKYVCTLVEYVWVCIKIAFVSLLVWLSGCAHVDKQNVFAPSPAAVVGSVAKAQQKAALLQGEVSPKGKAVLDDLNKSLFEAQVNVGKYVSVVDDQARKLADAQAEVIYWHDKQIAVLKKLWWWRLIAMGSILAVVAYIGIRTSWRFLL